MFAIADKKLQSVGEPARFMIQKDADARPILFLDRADGAPTTNRFWLRAFLL